MFAKLLDRAERTKYVRYRINVHNKKKTDVGNENTKIPNLIYDRFSDHKNSFFVIIIKIIAT